MSVWDLGQWTYGAIRDWDNGLMDEKVWPMEHKTMGV